MQRPSVILLSASLLAGTALAVDAQSQAPATGQADRPAEAAGEKPGLAAVRRSTSRSTVLAVDHQQRTATLRRDDGSEVTLDVPPRVRNFDQVQVGDQVTVEYDEATALFVRKPDAASGSSAPTGIGPAGRRSESVQTAPLGEKPAGVASRTVELTGEIENVDYDKRTVTVRGPRGNVRTLEVGADVTDLNTVKKGDLVVIRHTEAVAVTVTK
jgi:hypothetical protein